MSKYAVIYLAKVVVEADNEKQAKAFGTELLCGGRTVYGVLKQFDVYVDRKD